MRTITTLILLALVAAMLSACNGDGASPFDPAAPDETVPPVSACAASTACG